VYSVYATQAAPGTADSHASSVHCIAQIRCSPDINRFDSNWIERLQLKIYLRWREEKKVISNQPSYSDTTEQFSTDRPALHGSLPQSHVNSTAVTACVTETLIPSQKVHDQFMRPAYTQKNGLSSSRLKWSRVAYMHVSHAVWNIYCRLSCCIQKSILSCSRFNLLTYIVGHRNATMGVGWWRESGVNYSVSKAMSKSSSDARAGISIMPRASTVRSLCLLVLSMGLLMLYVGVYVEQSRVQCDHVARSRDDFVAKTTRDVIVNVTSRQAPVGDESSWDYNWDSYVSLLS